MAQQDEIATVIELEVNGFRYLIKGIMAIIKTTIKQLAAFHNWKNESHSSGSHSWSYIKAWSKEVPQVIQIPENMPEDLWKDFCKKNNIPYCDSIPDLDLTDRRKPVLFRSQDIVLIQQLIKPYVDELNKELETEKGHYEELEDKLNTTIRTSSDPEEIKKAKADLENVQCAKAQLQRVIDKNDEYTKNGNAMTFFDYLQQGKDTEFEKNPSLALAKLNEGVQLSKDYKLSEAMMLIRDPSLIPAGETIYLTCTAAENGSELFIKREFSVDENGLAVSNASIYRDGELIGQFNDKGLTPSEYRETMHSALKEAGVSEAEYDQFNFRTDLSSESRDAYEKFRKDKSVNEKVTMESQRKCTMSLDDIKNMGEDVTPTAFAKAEEQYCSYPEKAEYVRPENKSEGAKRFEKDLTADRVRREEEYRANTIELKVETSRLELVDGKQSYNIDGVGVVTGVEQRKDAAGNFNIAIHGDRNYVVIDEEGKPKAYSGNEIRAKMNSIKQAEGQSQTQQKTMAHHGR